MPRNPGLRDETPLVFETRATAVQTLRDILSSSSGTFGTQWSASVPIFAFLVVCLTGKKRFVRVAVTQFAVRLKLSSENCLTKEKFIYG